MIGFGTGVISEKPAVEVALNPTFNRFNGSLNHCIILLLLF